MDAALKVAGTNSCLFIVPEAVKWLEEKSAEVKEFPVTVTMLNRRYLNATVSVSSRSCALVRLAKQNCDADGTVLVPTNATCSLCKLLADTGLLCPHMVAAILEAHKNSSFGPSWSLFDLQFVTRHWHTELWLQQVSVEMPLHPFDIHSIDFSENPVLSWQFPPKRSGRKSKAAKLREDGHNRVRLTARLYKCIGCGEVGHNIKSCFNIDLDDVCLELELRESGRSLKKRKVVGNTVSVGDDCNSSSRPVESITTSTTAGVDSFVISANLLLVFNQQLNLLESDFERGVALSMREHSDLELAVTNLADLAFATYGRVEKKDIARDGNCMFDAARDQYGTVDLTLSQLTIQDVRDACVEYVIMMYGETEPDVLISTGRHTSWENWKENMSQDKFFGDELTYEALGHIYGGFNVFCVVGTTKEAYIKESGHKQRPSIYLGLELDRHVWSLQHPDDIETHHMDCSSEDDVSFGSVAGSENNC